jgi:hypothetical protein
MRAAFVDATNVIFHAMDAANAILHVTHVTKY